MYYSFSRFFFFFFLLFRSMWMDFQLFFFFFSDSPLTEKLELPFCCHLHHCTCLPLPGLNCRMPSCSLLAPLVQSDQVRSERYTDFLPRISLKAGNCRSFAVLVPFRSREIENFLVYSYRGVVTAIVYERDNLYRFLLLVTTHL